jgi:hypothetical protein
MPSEDALQFPDRLIVRLVEEDTGRPAPNIAITLTLYARKKNDYHLGPSLSDSSGTIAIDRGWVKRSVEEIKGFFLMDYYSTMEDCYPYVSVKVMSTDDIRRAIAAMELYGEVTQELGVAHSISDLSNASNCKYEPETMRLNMDNPNEAEREILIKLRRRSA